MSETNELDIFNLNIDDFQQAETSTRTSLYKTDPKNGKDSIYRAVVRFLPNPKNPKQSSMKKLTYWLTDSSGEGGYFDSPKTLDKTAPCIIGDLWWKLSQSESAADKKAAENLRRKEYYFSLVQIVKDPQNPDLEGTIQVYRYPKTLKKLLDNQINPDKADIDMGTEPCNVFDLFEGKDFNIKVTLKGGYWNYDECKFSEKRTPVEFNDQTIERTKESQTSFMEYLNASPDMSKYDYKPWNTDNESQLMKILREIDTSNPGKSYDTISDSTNNQEPVKAETKPELESNVDGLIKASAPADDLEDFLSTLEN